MASVFAATKSQNIRILELLLQGPVNPQDVQQAIIYAAQEGLAECLKCIISHGGDPNLTNNSGESLLHLATIEGHTSVVEVLCQAGADVCAKDSSNNAPVHIAAKWGKDDCLETLIQHKCNVNSKDSSLSTPLILAVKNKQYGAIRLLLDACCNVNASCRSGRTALHFGSLSGTAVEQLIRAGADVNICDVDGCSPLLYAATEGLERVVRCIVQAPHCNVNLANKGAGKTPLHILSHKGHHTSVRDLMEHGASPGIRDVDSKTALCYAVANGHFKVVKALLLNTFDIDDYQCSTEAQITSHNCPVQLAVDKELSQILKFFILTCFDSQHIIECLHQPKAAELFSDATEWIIQARRIPTLQQLCRKWIRHHVKSTRLALSCTQRFPIPQKFVDFIFMKELEECVL